MQSPILIILIVAAIITTVIGTAVKSSREEHAYSEGIAIWIAVALVSLITAGTDWQKDRQMQALNARKSEIEVKVIRGGEQLTCFNHEVVVGDVLLLFTGDKVVADGYCLESNLMVLDEASLTGEPDPVKKDASDPWLRSGTQVTEGSGRMLVLAVGDASEWGKTMALIRVKPVKTPLQVKLDVLVIAMGKLGVTVAVLAFIALMIRWIVDSGGWPWSDFVEGPIGYFIYAVTIIVVTIPEGLPLAVTIALASTMHAMLRDHNFVRVLVACETMGGATTICSDKTGTLTENRMTVVDGWFGGAGTDGLPAWDDLPAGLRDTLVENIALNSTAFLIEGEHGAVDFVGNRTECALLMLARGWGQNYKTLRDTLHPHVEQVYDFTSARKMSSVLMVPRPEGGAGQPEETHRLLLVKGASEMVLARSAEVVWADGSKRPITDELRAELTRTITGMASRGLRTLCLAMRDVDPTQHEDLSTSAPESELTLLCVVGIKDPVRAEVPDAVRTCQEAGIVVRMVTGDNIHTASHIARECGILTEGGLSMEGPEFRAMSEERRLEIVPHLQVLARSTPHDKHVLVHTLKVLQQVVAVTGDGTNDAPALKESDVGLAMGIAGTEVAKDAADIVILDDNFTSIVKAVLWGRNVFANIRKFLQFQLTVSFVALLVTFIPAVSVGQLPLNVLQLLWVNLVINSFAALAFAYERPGPELMEAKPQGRAAPLVTRVMAKNIVVQGCYQIFWLFLIFYGMPRQFSAFHVPSECEYYATSTNLCCYAASPDACLQANGGPYLPGETPLCSISLEGSCSLEEPTPAAFCDGSDEECSRYQQMQGLWESTEDDYHEAEENAQDETNTIVFNTFMFLQTFNFINSRMLRDEYNVLRGIHRAPLFIIIISIITGLQYVIVRYLDGIFHTINPSGLAWGMSVLIGLGGLPLALLAKYVCRNWFPIHEPTEEEIALKLERLQDPKYKYRRHWWQWLRPPPPKDVRRAWREERRERKRLSMGSSALDKSDNDAPSAPASHAGDRDERPSPSP